MDDLEKWAAFLTEQGVKYSVRGRDLETQIVLDNDITIQFREDHLSPLRKCKFSEIKNWK